MGQSVQDPEHLKDLRVRVRTQPCPRQQDTPAPSATDYISYGRGFFAFREKPTMDSLTHRGYGEKEVQMTEMTEILRAVNELSSRAACVRTLADKINAMSEESLGSFDAALLSMNLEIAVEALETVLEMAAYLSRPVVETSRLWKNGSGQYETTSGYCFCEGSAIEVLIPNSFNPDDAHWERTRLQYNGKDYCLAGYPDLPLVGLPVRVRVGDKP